MSIQDFSIFLDRVSGFANSKHVPLAKYIKHIYRHEGHRGLTIRLKVIFSWYLKILSGDYNYSKEGWGYVMEKGIKFPRLRYASLLPGKFVSAIKTNDYDYICAVLDVIKCYKFFQGPIKADYVTMLKEDIFFEEPKPPCDASSFLKDLSTTVKSFVKVTYKIDPLKDLKWHYTPSSVLLDVDGDCTATGSIASFATVHGDLVKDENYLVHRFHQLNSDSFTPKGKLTCVGEGGLKTRIVAVMSPVDSSVCRHVHEFLQDVLAAIPNDCMIDQEKGRVWIMERTARRLYVGSVDLKQASWHIPTSWLVAVGRAIGIPRGILRYFYDTEFKFEYIDGSTKCGKPTCAAMGLPGTFPLFSLTLHAVIRTLLIKIHKADPDCYRLLGDDIVVGSRPLFKELISLFKRWGIPVSMHKTFSSQHLAEFAGSIFYKGRDITPIGYTVLTPSSVNAAYRAEPLIKRYVERMGRHATMLLQPTSTHGRIFARLAKSPEQRAKILKQGTVESGGFESIYYRYYRNIIRLLSLLPPKLGGFMGMAISNKFLKTMLVKQDHMTILACRYLDHYLDSDDRDVLVYSCMPGWKAFHYQAFLDLYAYDFENPNWVEELTVAYDKLQSGQSLTKHEYKLVRLNAHSSTLQELGKEPFNNLYSREGVQLSVPRTSKEVTTGIYRLPLREFDRGFRGLQVPVVPLKRDFLFKPVTGFVVTLLNKRDLSRYKYLRSSLPKLKSCLKRLIIRANNKQQIKEAESYSLGSQPRFKWDRSYLTVRPEFR